MIDDLRNSANDQSFPDEFDAELEPLLKKTELGESKSNFASKLFNSSGLSAFQRFILAALLFFLVIILGIMLVMINSTSFSY